MILCFDIGGSRIKAALALGDDVQPLGDTPTPRDDFDAFLQALRGFVLSREITAVAISIAGVVHPDTGRIRVANIPCADGRPLAKDISDVMGLPVLVLNDADCFVLAETRRGAGRGHRNVFGVILGTGVGGGLVIDGRLVQGVGGYSGEWGHGPVLASPFDFPCGCGLKGCIDAACGARGLERLHLHLGGQAAHSAEILALWHSGDVAGHRTVQTWLSLIAPQLALVLNVVGASVVPCAGGLANDRHLLSALDAEVRKMILWQTGAPIVVPAECRVEPGLIGAAEAGREAFS